MRIRFHIIKNGKHIRVTEPDDTILNDETFSHPLTGTFNVSAIMRGINAGEIQPDWITFPLDNTWKRVAAEADIHPGRLAKVTDEECKRNPLLLIQTAEQWAVCADGSHRLRYMVDNGWEIASAAMVHIDKVRHLEIVAEESPDGQNWKPVDVAEIIDSMLGKFPMYEDDGKRKFYPDIVKGPRP